MVGWYIGLNVPVPPGNPFLPCIIVGTWGSAVGTGVEDHPFQADILLLSDAM